MGRIVIVPYVPKASKEAELLACIRKHLQVLRQEQLVTDRTPVVMRTSNGTIIEVFEWKSPEAIEQAHANPAILAMWAEFEAACDYVPLNQVAECGQMFAEFEPLDLE